MRSPAPALAAALLLVVSSTAALAQPPPGPISTNLSWDQCAGDGYVGDRSFACSDNSGMEIFYLSIVLHDHARSGIVAIDCALDVTPASAELPDWWRVDFGMCRPYALGAGAELFEDFPGCARWYEGLGPQPMTLFHPYYPEPGRFHVLAAAVLPADAPATLDTEREYVVLRFRLLHSRSTGPDVCQGCTVPTCIGLSRLSLECLSPCVSENFSGAGFNTLTWQGAYAAAYPTAPWSGPIGADYTNRLDCTLPPVPARNRTWGLIKTFYR